MENIHARCGPAHDRSLGGKSLRWFPSLLPLPRTGECSATCRRQCPCAVRKGRRSRPCGVAGVSATPRPAAAGQTPAEFISVIGTDVLQEMRADAPLAQKEDYFRQM